MYSCHMYTFTLKICQLHNHISSICIFFRLVYSTHVLSCILIHCGPYIYFMCACECCNGVLSSVQDGRSPLYVASEFGHAEVVDILLKNGACTNLATKVLRLVCSMRYCIFLPLAQLTTHLTCRVSFGCGCSCVCQRVSRNGSNTACTLQSLHQRFMSFAV